MARPASKQSRPCQKRTFACHPIQLQFTRILQNSSRHISRPFVLSPLSAPLRRSIYLVLAARPRITSNRPLPNHLSSLVLTRLGSSWLRLGSSSLVFACLVKAGRLIKSLFSSLSLSLSLSLVLTRIPIIQSNKHSVASLFQDHLSYLLPL
jgi:hypothetical protein